MWSTFIVLFALISAGPGQPLLLKAKTGMIAPVPQGKSLVISKNLRNAITGKSLYIARNPLPINLAPPPHDKTSSYKGVGFHIFPMLEGDTGLLTQRPAGDKSQKAIQRDPFASRAMADRFNYQKEANRRVGRSDQFLKQTLKRK